MQEIWKSITGYDGLYEVSNIGRVRSLDRRIWIQSINGGYYKNIKGKILKNISPKYRTPEVSLCFGGLYKTFTRASLVANEFLNNRTNNYKVGHKDGNVLNNNFDNLEYISEEKAKNNRINKIKRKVRLVETGQIFNSVADANSFLGRNKYNTTIYGTLSNSERNKTAYGYHWEYIN